MAGTGSSQLQVPIPSPVHASRHDEPPRPITKSHTPEVQALPGLHTHGCTHTRAHLYAHTHAQTCTHTPQHTRSGLPYFLFPPIVTGPHYGGRCEPLRQPTLPLLSPGLPEEQRADVCSVAICVLLDSIIISITPSFHPRSSVFSGNRDGWSLFTASRRGGGSHAAVVGTLSLVTDGEVTGDWWQKGQGEPGAGFPLENGKKLQNSPFPTSAGGEALSSASV